MRLISIALLILFALIIAVARVFRSGRSVRPDHHHWVVRVLGAVLFFAAVTAVGIGTWRGTTAELTSPPISVKAPTHPAPPNKKTDSHGNVDLGRCKLIGTVLLARQEQLQFFPLCGESRVLEWPAPSSSNPAFHVEHGGFTYDVTLDLREFVSWGSPGEIQSRNGISVITKGHGCSGSSKGSQLKFDSPRIIDCNYGRGLFTHAPLSIIPMYNSQGLRLLIHLTRAGCDDPLADVPVANWLDGPAGKARQDDPPAIYTTHRGARPEAKMPPGIRMLMFLGPSAFLLGLAAIAGSVVFRSRRRAPAFAGLLALMVLYAGLLDAVALRRRSGLANDSRQPESVRCLAVADMARVTFFHRGSAVDQVRAIAADPAAPASLRAFAGEVSGGDL